MNSSLRVVGKVRWSIALSALVLLGACSAGEPLVVAFVAPQTGPEAADSLSARRVLEHYIAEVNDAGGSSVVPSSSGCSTTKSP